MLHQLLKENQTSKQNTCRNSFISPEKRDARGHSKSEAPRQVVNWHPENSKI